MHTIISLLVDAVVLMFLIQFLVNERHEFFKSLIAAVIGAVAAAGLTLILGPIGGQHAALMAALIVAACIGGAVWFLFKISLANALILGIVFVVVRVGLSILLGGMLSGV